MKTSEIIRDYFIKNGGTVLVTTLRGKEHYVSYDKHGDYLFSETGLHAEKLQLSIFDMVTDLLIDEGGKVFKGNGRNAKVGEPNCTEDTICGYIATHYYGHKKGESTFDPVFIVCAILDKAGICENSHGYLKLL